MIVNDNNIETPKTPKNNEAKGIIFLAIGIMTVIAAIAGASYAYFAYTAINNNAVSGESDYKPYVDVSNPGKNSNDPLYLTVVQATQSSVGTKKLIPQLSAGIAKATNSTNKCLDANGNAVCKIYTITIKNTTTSTLYVDGILQLSASNMPNLRWRKCSAENTCTDAIAKPASTTSLGNTIKIAGGASSTLWFVVWINETGSAQTDSGTFTGTVTFTAYSTSNKTLTGVTSSITS